MFWIGLAYGVLLTLIVGGYLVGQLPAVGVLLQIGLCLGAICGAWRIWHDGKEEWQAHIRRAILWHQIECEQNRKRSGGPRG